MLATYLAQLSNTMNAPTLSPEVKEISEAAPNLHVVNENTAVTEDGLVLKNVDKVERLNVSVDSRVTAYFVSWQVCRKVRRDFLLVTTKIFKRSRRDKVFTTQTRDFLSEMAVQVEFLKEAASKYDPPRGDQLEYREVPLRIISPEAGLLYRLFVEADPAVARLTHACKADKFPREYLDELLAPFFNAYKDLHTYVLGQNQSTKTAAELGAESGIT